jgi:hypothetical protein
MKRSLTDEHAARLLTVLENRFRKNPARHPDLRWEDIRARLEAAPEKLWSLEQMEASDGEPDVVVLEKQTAAYVFIDCAVESPKGRRSLCYDRDGLESRKDHPPKNSAVDMAAEMGVELLDEAQYRQLQAHGPFDAKTSSWIRTPDAIREHGGALFGDYRYGHTFIYHNGAQSYYAARGFRSILMP